MAEVVIPNLTDSQKLNIDILKNITSINTVVNDIQHDTTENRVDIEKLKEIVIIGNGEVALRESVRTHASFIKEIKYWLKLVGGLLLAQFITITLGGVILYIKFLPFLEALIRKP